MGVWNPGPAGTSGNDTFTGDAAGETIQGFGGEDNLQGNDGDDTFIIGAASDISAGDFYFGGNGADSMRLTAIGFYNFQPTTSLLAIETLRLEANLTANFTASGGNDDWGVINGWAIDGGGRTATFNFQALNGASIQIYNWSFSNGNFTVNMYASAEGSTLFGSNVADRIFGGAGNDTLQGFDGADTLTGGAGNDTYFLNAFFDDAAQDTIVELADGGIDTIETQSSFSLVSHAHIENLESATNSAVTLTGNALDNMIFGGSLANDTLIGGAGNDTLGGGSGTDTLVGGLGDDTYLFSQQGSFDTITENAGEGADVIHVANMNAGTVSSFSMANYANVENLQYSSTNSTGTRTITGNGGNNVIAATGPATNDIVDGGGGDDTIIAGGGNDTLVGNSGVDTSGYTIASSAATWTRNANGTWTISAGANGTDTLNSVEFLDFTDRDVFLDRAFRTFSGNGSSDVLFRRDDGIIASWEVAGTTINSASFLPTAGAEWTPRATGDVSGDGRDDVIWQRNDGLVYAWLMNGGAVSSAVALTGIGAEWTFLGMGDFNGDLTDDFAWQRNDGLVYTWTMANAAIQSANAITGLGAEWAIEGFGDFNSDGRDDFVWRNTSGQTVIWQMNGSSIQSSGFTSTQVGLEWSIVGVGDTNGDGRDDIVLQRASDGMLAVWAMDGTSVLSAANIGAASPAEWTVSGIGDYNGDGRDDILWQNDNGLVYTWLLNGSTIIGAGGLSGVGAEWTIVGGG